MASADLQALVDYYSRNEIDAATASDFDLLKRMAEMRTLARDPASSNDVKIYANTNWARFWQEAHRRGLTISADQADTSEEEEIQEKIDDIIGTPTEQIYGRDVKNPFSNPVIPPAISSIKGKGYSADVLGYKKIDADGDVPSSTMDLLVLGSMEEYGGVYTGPTVNTQNTTYFDYKTGTNRIYTIEDENSQRPKGLFYQAELNFRILAAKIKISPIILGLLIASGIILIGSYFFL